MKHLVQHITESLFDKDLVKKDTRLMKEISDPRDMCKGLHIQPSSKNIKDIKLMLKKMIDLAKDEKYKVRNLGITLGVDNLIGFCRHENAERRLEYEFPKSLIDGALVIAIFEVPGKDWCVFYSWDNDYSEFERYEDLSDNVPENEYTYLLK